MPGTVESRRTAIMNAAQDLFVERGFHGAPTSLIARRAGVGVGTIYRYFPSKDELVHRIFDHVHVRFHQAFSEETDPGAPLRERFILLIGRLLTVFAQSSRDFLFMEQYHYSPFAASDMTEIPEADDHAIRRILREGLKAGLFKDAPVSVLQCLCFGPLVSLAKEHHTGRLNVDEGTIRTAAEACWDSLRK